MGWRERTSRSACNCGLREMMGSRHALCRAKVDISCDTRFVLFCPAGSMHILSPGHGLRVATTVRTWLATTVRTNTHNGRTGACMHARREALPSSPDSAPHPEYAFSKDARHGPSVTLITASWDSWRRRLFVGFVVSPCLPCVRSMQRAQLRRKRKCFVQRSRQLTPRARRRRSGRACQSRARRWRRVRGALARR